MRKLVNTLQTKNFESFSVCFNCNVSSVVFDDATNEEICNKCGIVINEQFDYDYVANNSKKFELTSNHGMPSSLARFDKGLYTTISTENTDAYGYQLNTKQITKARNMRHWNRISNRNTNNHRNLKKAFSILIRIKDKLSFSGTIVEKSAYYYRKILELGLLKGRSIREFVVACVYITCREMNIPRTISEISEIACADKIFVGRCYRLILRHLKIKLPLPDSTTNLSRIANIAGISRKTLHRAYEMTAIIKRDSFLHGNPTALSIAILYGACVERGERISQLRIAAAGNMSIVTLRKRYQEIRQIFPTLRNGYQRLTRISN